MAGDWIKMRGNLWDDPRVTRLCDLTEQGEAAIVGGLYWLWATADQHTEDGVMPGLSLRQVDRKTGVPGLGEALREIGWIADHPEGIRIVNFEDHNGASAKKRCQTAKRVANFKAGNGEVTPPALPDEQGGVTTPLPREEKRREEEEETRIPPAQSGANQQAQAPAAAPTESPPPVPPAPKEPPAPRALKKCPAGFVLSEGMRSWAAENAPSVDVETSTAMFVDHTFSRAIQDWPGAWRNWLRRDQLDHDNRKQRPGQPAMSFRERDEQAARDRAAEFTGQSTRRVIDITPPPTTLERLQ